MANQTPIDSHKHQDASRANIPTEELRDFVTADEHEPKTMRYPRNPDLDPQLVWRGKDAQDSGDLEVPVVPVYIQEKVHPRALIEDLRTGGRSGQPQLDFFSDFNGIAFEQLIEFYQHNQHWQNRLILGDSLQVMTSLAEKERLKGKVQMIYLDPPYGIKFGSNWQVSTRKRDVKDGKAEDLTRQPEQIKAFRDTWEYGIHSYLPHLRDRLQVARELLTESGSIFVQIGDDNVHRVRAVMDEVFGAENFISSIILTKTPGLTAEFIANVEDYIIWYARSKKSLKYRPLLVTKGYGEDGSGKYDKAVDRSLVVHVVKKEMRSGFAPLPDNWSAFRHGDLSSQRQGRDNSEFGAMSFPFEFQGGRYVPAPGRGWTTTINGIRRLVQAGRVDVTGSNLSYRRFLNDFCAFPLTNVWTDIAGIQSRSDPKVYVVQTATEAIKRCLLMTTDPGDLVLDPTCGSGTTAYVAEQWGRRWITIDTSRVALALARTRLMAARYPYYLLADSQDGRRKAMELSGTLAPPDAPPPRDDIKQGFVYKTVPHVTLKAIANNAEIDSLHAAWQETLEPLRAELNRSLDKHWQEWEVPREAETPWASETQAQFARLQTLRKTAAPDAQVINSALQALNTTLKRQYTLDTLPPRPADPWPAPIAETHRQWWEARRARQQAIDGSIARNAETETLFDQPYEDKKRVRVTGPFTVESLSPHRVLPTTDEGSALPQAERDAKDQAADFALLILDNLRKAGVQNTVKQERLTFDRLEPLAGCWLQAEGEYTEKDGSPRRVAVSLGPEHGTLGAFQVKEAAKEAIQGLGFDLLLVCAFAFDPSVTEEAKRYGRLRILPVKMNPDLAMGDELLKKTGSGNLFMVFGEPDIAPVDPKTGKLIPQQDGRFKIEIRGLDIYDPTTGQIRSHGTDDIACWFIDTDYNGESFFVRHAYFTGGDKPYEKLKRALKADIDEAAWEALYRTRSRAFPPPLTGKIAVKVINHYGDEVLKVFEV
ncbi:site-specific DNA-methyltransferase [uncultured Thiodictyon sp.]|uniref:site-specific DNA-methyltransferase n=1 Tax=uncultured Thiodictyon sp. TaxID=1846217 RepID=UPI0025D3C830|nr:site-specific DNA-methyltransferase [uncultured Thiodictyon sp.]